MKDFMQAQDLLAALNFSQRKRIVCVDIKEAYLDPSAESTQGLRSMNSEIMLTGAECAALSQMDFQTDFDHKTIRLLLKMTLEGLLKEGNDVWPRIAEKLSNALREQLSLEIEAEGIVEFFGYTAMSIIPRVEDGKILRRPGLRRWIEFLRSEEIDHCIVCSAPRLYSWQLMQRWGIQPWTPLFGGEIAAKGKWAYKPKADPYINTLRSMLQRFDGLVVVIDNPRNIVDPVVQLSSLGYEVCAVTFAEQDGLTTQMEIQEGLSEYGSSADDLVSNVLVLESEQGFLPLLKQ